MHDSPATTAIEVILFNRESIKYMGQVVTESKAVTPLIHKHAPGLV